MDIDADLIVAPRGFASSMSRWHLVMTKPASEAKAVVHLQRQGYVVYFPRLSKKILSRGRWLDRIVALFPRYLFVQVNSHQQSLASIRSTVGVAGLVRFGIDYIIVPDEVVATLRRKEDPAVGLHCLRTSEWIKPGELVRIAAGALSGLEGIFKSDDGNQRVTVLLNWLGRETSVHVDADCIISKAV